MTPGPKSPSGLPSSVTVTAFGVGLSSMVRFGCGGTTAATGVAGVGCGVGDVRGVGRGWGGVGFGRGSSVRLATGAGGVDGAGSVDMFGGSFVGVAIGGFVASGWGWVGDENIAPRRGPLHHSAPPSSVAAQRPIPIRRAACRRSSPAIAACSSAESGAYASARLHNPIARARRPAAACRRPSTVNVSMICGSRFFS